MGGFIDDVDRFDAEYFGISPREAARMDPQQRILLEVATEALDDAGQPAGKLAGQPVGVFIGVCASDYAYAQFGDLETLDAYAATGNAHSIVANRLSYALDLQGPSVAVDTACSSSLVAVHLAAQSLQLRESSLAIVGGVHLMLAPYATIAFSKAQMMAPDGRCKTFDARADGFVRGEGCGVVVLKRLADALADEDPIRCGDSRHGGEPGRPQQRTHGAKWSVAANRNSSGARSQRAFSRCGDLCRSARYGHLARRSHRSRSTGCGFRRQSTGWAAVRSGVRQNEYRTS